MFFFRVLSQTSGLGLWSLWAKGCAVDNPVGSVARPLGCPRRSAATSPVLEEHRPQIHRLLGQANVRFAVLRTACIAASTVRLA